MVPAVAL